MARWNDSLPIKLTNVAAYVLFLSSNAYSTLSPQSAHHGAGWHETYVTPQSWIFSIWGVIHTLLLGFVIYQFFPDGHEPAVKHIGWRFAVLSILTSAYAGLEQAGSVHTGHNDGRVYRICAFVALLLSAGVVSHIYRDLKTSHAARNWADTIFVHTPFSLYHGFVVVLLVVSGFGAFGVNAVTHHDGVITKILVFIALLFLEATAVGYVFYGKGDIGGALVICLSLLAIFQHQTSSAFIHWSALAFFIISLIAVLRASIAAFRGGRIALTDEERAPLVG